MSFRSLQRPGMAHIFRALNLLRGSHSLALTHSSQDHPYHPGRALKIFYKPEIDPVAGHDPFFLRDVEINSELSPAWTGGFTPLTISILNSFTPFTSAVVLQVKVLEGAGNLSIPDDFILKLNDRRFGYRDLSQPKAIWDPQIEDRLREEIPRILGCGRPIPDLYYDAPVRAPHHGTLPLWDGWELEIYVWTLKIRDQMAEALAYRRLSTLQGTFIPRLYGTVRLPISPGTAFVHPIVDFVPGLAIEHIPSPNLGALTVGTDISKPVANHISRQLIDNVARVRDAGCHHRDIRLANIVLRNWPHAPEPALIDFGLATVMPPDYPGGAGAWDYACDEVVELRKLLANPKNGGWHVASPYQQYMYDPFARACQGSPRSGPRSGSGSGSGSGLRSGPRPCLRSDLRPSPCSLRRSPRRSLRPRSPAPATPPELRFRIPRGL
ncbi:hypothetical protein B0H15DRAFT_904851 [Mycena belliarum]|uniref:Protein kinase domain-containing protein n=1 Tax=Mycena belliarum TaxID=1033014 RepID=A0AAD6U927_9AGAR|nr:hypothetical protein B0H15DRAFT_904851 [Mycena belliae]